MKNIFAIFLLITFGLSDVNYAQNIASGSFHSVILCADGTVKTCGVNNYGQLGINNTEDQIVPVQVMGLSDIINVSAFGDYSLFLKRDSSVWACGRNDHGQLGVGDNSSRLSPVQINGLSGIIAISAGLYHTIFLKKDGTVWACGSNWSGELGNGTFTDSSIPVKVDSISSIVAIAAGGSHSLFLKEDGTVWACGSNSSGQLGDTLNWEGFPQKNPNLTGIVAIGAGDQHSLFVKNDGTVWASGLNSFGTLGDGTNIDRPYPVKVSGLTGVTSVKGGVWHSLFLKSNGTAWACGTNLWGYLGNTNAYPEVWTPWQVQLSNITAISASDNFSLFLKNDGTVWGCGANYGALADSATSDTFLDPINLKNLCYVSPLDKKYSHTISGTLYDDKSNDCNKQVLEQGLTLPIRATPGNLFNISDEAGNYSLGINNTTNYTIRPVVPQRLSHLINSPCPASYSISLKPNDIKDTTGLDFGFNISPCHQLRVDVSSNRRRRCFRNFTSVYFINEGFSSASGVEVHVKMPPYVIPISASLSYTWNLTDSTMVFALGTLNKGEDGYIAITDSVSCLNGITGLTQCTKAWITPINQCLIDSTKGPNWDHSSIKVEGSCVNDTTLFIIYNNGSGNMVTSSQYRIYADNILMQTASFQLISGDSSIVKYFSNGATIRLEADQHPEHPGNSKPRVTIEGCSTDGSGAYTKGMVNDAPQDDADIDVEFDCMEIRDSYDPNEKLVSPEGIDAIHKVLNNTSLDFTIHFQNTGTDTAYKVVVIDTLISNYFDLSTLELGASSSPYKTSIYGEGKPVLKFTFDNINLTDTFTNELKSHGFIKFKIAPLSNSPLGTQLKNSANIYFDYNFPIKTNTAFVTLGNYSVATGINETLGLENRITVYPNPANNEITVRIQGQLILGDARIEIFDLLGRQVKSIFEIHENETKFSLSNLSKGIYFVKLLDKVGREYSAEKVIVQ